ncbi:MAG TPA: MarR family transcriptional regulator [Solirubrobacterales bacterium]|nr:MarR family transcriptional regulator [Solirubrobacterales bacterium]
MASTSSDLLSDRELAAWKGMLEVHAVLVAQLDRELERDHGLPLTSYEVLMYLGDADREKLRMSELADRLLLSRSGITRLVDRLVRQGLIVRERCADDRRGYYAQLTDAGRAKLGPARRAHLAGVRQHFLDRLDSEQIDGLGEIWRRLLVQAREAELDEAPR